MTDLRDPAAREQLAQAIAGACEVHGGVVTITTPAIWPHCRRVEARFASVEIDTELCGERGWPVLVRWVAPEGRVFSGDFRYAVKDIFNFPFRSSITRAMDPLAIRLALDNGLNLLPVAHVAAPPRKTA